MKCGEVRYVLLMARMRPTDFTRWVRANGKPVDDAEWRSVSPEGRRQIQLYELRAD